VRREHAPGGERGVALVLALLALVVLAMVGGALVTVTITETAIAARFRDGVQAFYAADGALERALAEVAAAPDWAALIDPLPAAASDPSWRVLIDGPATDVLGSDDADRRLVVSVWLRAGPSDGLLTLRARAAGTQGVARTIEAVAARGEGGVRLVTWAEAR
jgi:hypothetical protein